MSARTVGREWISVRIKLSAALLLSLLLLGAGASEARAAAEVETKSFDPVRKTQRALFFDLRSVEPARIIRVHARMRLAHKRLHRQLRRRFQDRPAARRRAHRRAHTRLRRQRQRQINVNRVRRVVSSGERLRLRKPKRMRGGRVRVVVEEPPSAGDITDGDTTDGDTGEVYAVPSSVPAGCSIDATSLILAWIATVPDDSTLRFGDGACYRIDGTLELRDRNLRLDGNGSTFRSLNPPTSHRALWRVWDSTVVFRDMMLIGSYANGGVHDPNLQWAHGIDLRGTHGVVENVSMSDLAGDCVYFGLGAERSSGAVRDSSCRRIGRNGVSVVAGDDIRVERMSTDQIGYIAFDVEPNEGPGYGSSRVVFDQNTIGSYHMKAYTVIGNAPIADQAFTNNRVVAAKGLEIGVIDKSHRPQSLRIAGNVAEQPAKHNAMNLDDIDGLRVTGNVVPVVSGGTMAQVRYSCDVNVSGNSYPGGSREVWIVDPAC